MKWTDRILARFHPGAPKGNMKQNVRYLVEYWREESQAWVPLTTFDGPNAHKEANARAAEENAQNREVKHRAVPIVHYS